MKIRTNKEVKKNSRGLLQHSHCPYCADVIIPEKDFNDEVHKNEYKISGLCEKCQEGTFFKIHKI